MNILITGGTGLIGRYFIKKYKQEHNFTVLTRQIKPHVFPSAIKNSPQRDKTRIIHDLNQFKHLNDFDAVINLQGEPLVNKRWSKKQKYILCNSRWQVTSQLAQLINLSSSPPEVFLSGSAIGFYGRQQALNITENHSEVSPEFSHQLCRTWEEKALSCQDNTRVCLLRTGIVLSKDAGALKKMLTPFYFGLGGPIATGLQVMSWIHVADICNALEFILRNNELSGAINLTAPAPVTNLVFSQLLARQLHRPCLLPMPGFVLKLLLGEMAELLINGQHVIPKKLLNAGFSFNYPQIDSALKHLLP